MPKWLLRLVITMVIVVVMTVAAFYVLPFRLVSPIALFTAIAVGAILRNRDEGTPIRWAAAALEGGLAAVCFLIVIWLLER